MKQSINEIKRMQQLAGIISESQLNEPMYYVYDKEGMEEPIGPFTLDQAKQELAKQGPEWGIMDEKTAKEVYTYLEDDMSETKNKEEESFGGINENSILSDEAYERIDGLVNQNDITMLGDAGRNIVADLTNEGFDDEEIIEYICKYLKNFL